MRYMIAAVILFWGFAFLAYRVADRPGDNFGAGVLAWVLLVVSILLTLTYAGLALWHHRLL